MSLFTTLEGKVSEPSELVADQPSFSSGNDRPSIQEELYLHASAQTRVKSVLLNCSLEVIPLNLFRIKVWALAGSL